MATIITLACAECKERNYSKPKSGMKKKGAGGQRPRLSLKKYCPRCRKHTNHQETR